MTTIQPKTTIELNNQHILNSNTKDVQDQVECQVREQDLHFLEPLSKIHEGFKYHVYFISKGRTQFDEDPSLLKHFDENHTDSELHPESFAHCRDIYQLWYQSQGFTEENSVVLSAPTKATIETILRCTGKSRPVYIHPALANINTGIDGKVDETEKKEDSAEIIYSTFAEGTGPKPTDRDILNKSMFDTFWDNVVTSVPVQKLTGENRYIIIGGHAKWLRYMSHDLEIEHHDDWSYLARVQVPKNTIVRFFIYSDIDRKKEAPVGYGHPSIAFALRPLTRCHIGHSLSYGVENNSRKALRISYQSLQVTASVISENIAAGMDTAQGHIQRVRESFQDEQLQPERVEDDTRCCGLNCCGLDCRGLNCC